MKVEIIKPDRRAELKRIAESASMSAQNLSTSSRPRSTKKLSKSSERGSSSKKAKRTPKPKHSGVTELIEDLAAKIEDEIVDATEQFLRGIFR